ncbi:MAG: hypothetical protein PHV17_02145 [Candidatus Omnitrophica bacterium]|nr:hypothetical protein [Candidatus Omnitrophota bacterium]
MIYKAFIVSLLSFFCFCIFHIIIFHKLNIKHKFRTIFSLVALITVFDLLLYFSLTDIFFSQYALSKFVFFSNPILLYLLCLYFYHHFMIIIDRSVSIRMAVDIFFSGNRGLTIEEIKQEYDLYEKLRDELRDMTFIGRIKKEGEFYQNTDKGLQHARVFKFLKRFLHLKGAD